MSSLRNAVKRKTHKERSQPNARKKYGLLEKKEDYVKRSTDYHNKQKRLKVLKRKAAFKNPDEFYYGMVKAKTKDGIHSLDHKELSADEVKLIRSQNSSYLEVVKGREEAAVDRLKESLHFIGEKPVNKHTIFVDTEEEARVFDKAEYFNTLPEFADRSYNRPTKDALQHTALVLGSQGGDPSEILRNAKKLKEKSYEALYKKIDRKNQVKNVLAHLQTHKHLSGKGARIKIKGSENGKPPVFKWVAQRKK